MRKPKPPVRLRVEILKLLRSHYGELSFSTQEIESLEIGYQRAYEACEKQFIKCASGQKATEAAPILANKVFEKIKQNRALLLMESGHPFAIDRLLTYMVAFVYASFTEYIDIEGGGKPIPPQERKHVERWKNRRKKDVVADNLCYEVATCMGSKGAWDYKDGQGAICVRPLPDNMSEVVLSLEVESVEALQTAKWLCPETTILGEAAMSVWLHACATNNLMEQKTVLIPITKLLEIRGNKQEPNGGYKVSEKKEISDKILKLNRIEGKGIYVTPSRRRIQLYGQFYNVTGATELGYDKDQVPVGILFRPGDSVYDYYKGATHLAPYYEKLATLNVNRSASHSMAYLIGRYLTYQWCIREVHGNLDQPFRVDTILIGSGIEKESNRTHYDRFVGYFDEAFEILGVVGFLPKDDFGLYFDYIKNDEGEMPPHIACNDEVRGKVPKPYGWFETWLDWLIHVEPPPGARERSLRRVEARSHRIALESKKPRRRRQSQVAASESQS